EFEHLIISSYQVSGSGHASEIPMEQISFNYTTVKLTYQAQDETGSKKGGAVLGGWDVKKGVVKT
ncbi:MAG: hypothetical protein JWR08_1027, partial [Enterovirga sp.]|nr:hypothetical protein [Enterovirga sp.]